MSASSITLNALRDKVEALLIDNSNAIWGSGLLDEAIGLALAEYSTARPWKLMATLALTSILSANGREIDLSSLSDLVRVERLWAPYAAADNEPSERQFEHWLDAETLYIPDGAALTTSDSARVFYCKQHTLNGLDSAVATTFVAGDEAIVALGAVGYALLSRANDVTEQVTLSADTVDLYRDLSDDFLREFRQRLGVAVAKPGR